MPFDDDAPPGSLPSPDSRPWRHPSELALTPPPPSTGRGAWLWALGFVTVAAGCVVIFTFGLVASSPAPDESYASGVPDVSTSSLNAFGQALTGTTGPLRTSHSETPSPTASPTTTSVNVEAFSSLRNVSWIVVGYDGDRPTLTGALTIVSSEYGPLAVTSRSTLQASPFIDALTPQGTAITFSIASVDPSSDLVLLEPSDEIDLLAIQLSVPHDGSQPVDELCTLSSGLGTVCGVFDPSPSNVYNRDGEPMEGLIGTSILHDSVLPGAALVDQNGGIVGVTVDTDTGLLMAQPIETVTAILERLHNQPALDDPTSPEYPEYPESEPSPVDSGSEPNPTYPDPDLRTADSNLLPRHSSD